MIVELILKEEPTIEVEGYKKTKLHNGALFSSPLEKTVEVVVKKHPDGRVSVFTDNAEVIEGISKTSEIIDLHPH